MCQVPTMCCEKNAFKVSIYWQKKAHFVTSANVTSCVKVMHSSTANWQVCLHSSANCLTEADSSSGACLEHVLMLTAIRSPKRRQILVSIARYSDRDHSKGNRSVQWLCCMSIWFWQYLSVTWYAWHVVPHGSHTSCFTQAMAMPSTTYCMCVQWTDYNRPIVNYSGLFSTALGGASDHDHLMMTSQSSITASSDRGKS